MSFKAISYRFLIKPDEVVEKTESGIVLALDHKLEKGATQSGIILDIGEDGWDAYHPKTKHAGLVVGDRVFFAKYSGSWLKYKGVEVMALNDADIIAKWVEDDSDQLAT